MTQDPNQPQPRAFMDPVLQEQFETQMLSQYKWQANNTWIYWPFIALCAAMIAGGVLVFFSNVFMGGDIIVGFMFGGIVTFVGAVGTWSLWTGYKTAREMADKLKTAEAEGRLKA